MDDGRALVFTGLATLMGLSWWRRPYSSGSPAKTKAKARKEIRVIHRPGRLVRGYNVIKVIADRQWEGRDHLFVAFTYPDGRRGVATDDEFYPD
jgi:hypothetical protein